MERKNLLIISNHYLTFVKDQVETLSSDFNNISVIVRSNPILNKLINRRIIDDTNIPQNVQIYGTPILYIPIDSQYKKLGESHYRASEKTIRKNHLSFDFIHAHFTWSAGYAGARLKEEYNVPFIVTAHGYDIYSVPFKDDEWREKIEYVLNTADHIITVSRSNLACIEKLNVSTPVTVIPNGFRDDLFYPRDSSECKNIVNLPQDKKIILTIGNLDPVKGQKYLIDAMNVIVKERNDILCVIIGKGKEKHNLEKQIRSLGLEDHIMLPGGKQHDKIPLWINACDIIVLSSLNEGVPTVMFEALGCGKPFVGTRVGGVPEIILSDDYGYLVEPADAEDLAKKILLALNREWNQKNILAYAKRYTWENITKKIVEVYKQVLR